MRSMEAITRNIRADWRLPGAYLRNSWTLANKVLFAAMGLTILFNVVYGIYPACFNFKKKKFEFSVPLAIYCFSVSTLFGAYYAHHIWDSYTEDQINIRDPIEIYCYMCATQAVINYLIQWIMIPEIIRFQNSLPLLSTMRFFAIPIRVITRFLFLGCLKMFGCPLLMHVTLLMYQRHKDHEINWMQINRIMLPIYLGNQMNNCFYGSLLLARCVLLELNRRVHVILLEVNNLQTPLEILIQKSYYRMQRFCDLADRLDELASKYKLTTEHSMKYMDLVASSLVMSMTIILISTTFGIYTQYQFVAQYLMMEESYDILKALANIVFVAVPIADIYLIARLCQQMVDEANETGNLLQQIFLENVDIRFNQVVDAFWFDVHAIKFKLVPMGLLELDGSLINMVLSAVSEFLLFLIQNDLTLRFSLK